MDEWKGLPFDDQHRAMITVNLPFFFRWKVMQIKLMLNDLKDIQKYHGVDVEPLYEQVKEEAQTLMSRLADDIVRKRRMVDSKIDEFND